MDNSVDTNVLEDNTPACSSTQVMNLGAVVPTDPTTCTTVSMLGYATDCGNLAKPIGGAVYNNEIYLLTDKTYLLNKLKFGYACIITNSDNSICTSFSYSDSCSYITSNEIHGIGTISYGDQSGVSSVYQLLSFSDNGLTANISGLTIHSPNLNGGISFKAEQPDSYYSLLNVDTNTINTCSDSLLINYNTSFCVTDGLNTMFSSEIGTVHIGCSDAGETYISGYSTYIDNNYGFYIRDIANDYHEIMSFDGTELKIDTSLYNDVTKQGTYEATKGISDIGINNNIPYIPDLVNRIFNYTGSCTSFSAIPKYTNQMKDNILYEYEVWHTIPDASNVAYMSPTDVEWLYGDPAESGIELTDGITLYYAFRAFKSDGAVRVQGNLYATTTSQAANQ